MFLLLALPFSCQHPAELPLPEVLTDPSISVEEAKTWFEGTYGGAAAPNARTDKKQRKGPLWADAKTSKFKKGHPIIVIPLVYDKSDRLTASFNGSDHPTTPESWESRHTLIRKLIVFKNKKNENQAVVMYVIPTRQYKRSNPKAVKGENFTGIIVFKDYEEEILLESWRLENGRVKGVEFPKKAGKPKKNGRVAAWCMSVEYGHWDCPPGNPPSKLGGGDGPNRRLSAVMEDCNFVVDYREEHCFDPNDDGGGNSKNAEQDGGYFGDQLPSGSGGGGFVGDAYNNANEHSLADDFLFEYASQLDLSVEERQYFRDYPQLIEPIAELIKTFGIWVYRADAFLEDLVFRAMGKTMHPNERAALRSIGEQYYLINLGAYAMSAYWAEKATDKRLPQGEYPDLWTGRTPGSCAVCKGNAYKHAIFAAYNSHIFESTRIARDLGEGHEEGEIQRHLPGQPRTPASKMDIFNNERGYDVYNENFLAHSSTILKVADQYERAVLDKFNHGDLMYLVETTDGQVLETLTPTNQ